MLKHSFYFAWVQREADKRSLRARLWRLFRFSAVQLSDPQVQRQFYLGRQVLSGTWSAHSKFPSRGTDEPILMSSGTGWCCRRRILVKVHSLHLVGCQIGGGSSLQCQNSMYEPNRRTWPIARSPGERCRIGLLDSRRGLDIGTEKLLRDKRYRGSRQRSSVLCDAAIDGDQRDATFSPLSDAGGNFLRGQVPVVI